MEVIKVTEHCLNVYCGISMAVGIGYVLSMYGKFLMASMEFGGIFWKFKYNKALNHSTKCDKIHNTDFVEQLKQALKETFELNYDSQPEPLNGFYKRLAAKDYKFVRWVCSTCLTVYITCIFAVLSVPILYLIGFSPYFIFGFVFSVPMFSYKF